jgi:ribosomal protein S12
LSVRAEPAEGAPALSLWKNPQSAVHPCCYQSEKPNSAFAQVWLLPTNKREVISYIPVNNLQETPVILIRGGCSRFGGVICRLWRGVLDTGRQPQAITLKIRRQASSGKTIFALSEV